MMRGRKERNTRNSMAWGERGGGVGGKAMPFVFWGGESWEKSNAFFFGGGGVEELGEKQCHSGAVPYFMSSSDGKVTIIFTEGHSK